MVVVRSSQSVGDFLVEVSCFAGLDMASQSSMVCLASGQEMDIRELTVDENMLASLLSTLQETATADRQMMDQSCLAAVRLAVDYSTSILNCDLGW